MKIAAYVQNADGCPLMPVYRAGRVRRMLKTGKARVVSKVPLVIRLTSLIENPATQMVIIGQDPGRTNIGLCAIDGKGRVLYASDVETRNKYIAGLMLARKQARNASRSGRRKVRRRRARQCGTTFAWTPGSGNEISEFAIRKTGMGTRMIVLGKTWQRMLPQCKKPVPCHDIRNKKARFSNQKRKRGWLTPTANQLLQTHKSALDLVLKILPATDIVAELNKFSFARMENPDIYGKEFCHGPLYGFLSVEEAVSAEQGGHCIFCKKEIGHCHHIKPKSKGGTDALPNRAGLCEEHHTLVHTQLEWHDKLVKKKNGLNKKYGALSVLNQVLPYYWEYLQRFEPFIHVHAAGGWKTAETRKALGLDKEHYVDAWCIAASILTEPLEKPAFGKVFHIMQFRRHNRARILRTESRKYSLDGEVVAVNRNKAVQAVPKKKSDGSYKYDEDGNLLYTEKSQDVDSLHEFREKLVKEKGEAEARRIISRLTVTKSRHVYNTPGRLMPGAVFEVNGERQVLSGQHNNCSRYVQAISGVKALKEEKKACGKKLREARKKDGAEAGQAALEKRISEIEAKIPKAKEYQETICTVILHNAGLVYVTEHAS